VLSLPPFSRQLAQSWLARGVTHVAISPSPACFLLKETPGDGPVATSVAPQVAARWAPPPRGGRWAPPRGGAGLTPGGLRRAPLAARRIQEKTESGSAAEDSTVSARQVVRWLLQSHVADLCGLRSVREIVASRRLCVSAGQRGHCCSCKAMLETFAFAQRVRSCCVKTPLRQRRASRATSGPFVVAVVAGNRSSAGISVVTGRVSSRMHRDGRD